MPIERFIWTTHAGGRCAERLLDRSGLERAIREDHANRQINRGEAQWRIYGLLADGRNVVAVYDHPHDHDPAAVRIVSVWDF